MATVVEMTIEKIDEVKSRLGRLVYFFVKFMEDGSQWLETGDRIERLGIAAFDMSLDLTNIETEAYDDEYFYLVPCESLGFFDFSWKVNIRS